MRPDTLPAAGEGFAARRPAEFWRRAWVRHGCALALATLALIAVTHRAWFAMAHQWWNISTYNHILFVPLIAGWFVWLRRDELAKLTPQAWWPGLALLFAALFVWVIGSLAEIDIVAQAGVVLALQALVPILLGLRVARMLLFPLLYLCFLVPFGDALVPALQMVTAVITIHLTRLSGIDAAIDGVFIDTPAGLFEVAEACSGVKFLVAMAALGVLVAYACFRSPRRRAVFLAAAFALPILANGVRAWGTIAIAQALGIEFAQGFDHVVYGWVFFALVVAALLAASWRWFERVPEETGPSAEQVIANPMLSRLSAFGAPLGLVGGAAVGLILLAGAWNAFAITSSAPDSSLEAVRPMAVPGWNRVAIEPETVWEPVAQGADRRVRARFEDPAGRQVDLFLARWDGTPGDHDPSAAGQDEPADRTAWRRIGPGHAVPTARTSRWSAPGEPERLAETRYRIGDLTTGSSARYSLARLRHRLVFASPATMMLVLSTEDDRAALEAFRSAMGEPGVWIDRSAGIAR